MNNRIYPTSDVEADAPDTPVTFYIEGDGHYTHVEQGFLIIDVTDGDWDTDLWYLVTNVCDNMVSITPTHVGVTASVKKDGKYICVPSATPTTHSIKTIE